MSEIVAVTKQGYNVLTETNPNNFIFHSSYNTFKILAQGIFNPTAIPANTSFEQFRSFSHGQSFIPFVFAFVKWPDGKVGMPMTAQKGSEATNPIYNSSLYVDATTVTFGFINNSASPVTVSIAYFICEVPAN